MKRSMFFAALAVMFILSSCGASRRQVYYVPQASQQTVQSQNQSTLGVEIEKSPAQKLAEDVSATTLRAYGSYTHLKSVNGVSLATGQARGALATSIAALVKSTVKTYAEQYSKEKMTDAQLEIIMDANTKANQALEEVAQELIRYAPVLEHNSYVQSGNMNGMVTTHVCVELHPDRILQAVKENKEYVDAINADQKLEIDFNSEYFDQSMAQAFEDLKQAKANEGR